MARIKPNEARQAQQFALNKPETFERAVPPRFPKREDTMRTMVDPTVETKSIPVGPTCCPYPWHFADGRCGQCGKGAADHIGLDLMRAEDDGMIPVESRPPDLSDPVAGLSAWVAEHREISFQAWEPPFFEKLLRWAEAPVEGTRVVSLMDDLNPNALGPDARYGTVTGYDRDLHLPVITWDHPRVDVEACEPHEYEVVS